MKYIEYNIHVANCGTAIGIIFFTPGIAGLFIGCGTKFNSKFLKFYSCSIQFFWLIIGMIMIVSLSDMRDAVEANHSRYDEFKIFNECADEYAFVQIEELKYIQSEELGKIELLWTLCFASFMMIAAEIFGATLMCCGMICKQCFGTDIGRAFKTNFDQFCKEAAAFMSLYKVLG